MRYVRKGSAVYKCRNSLYRLYKVGVDGITKQCCHCALCLDVTSSYRLAVVCVRYNDPAKASFEIFEAVCKTEDRHYL